MDASDIVLMAMIIGITSVFGYWTKIFFNKKKTIENVSIFCMKSVIMISTVVYFYILIREPGKISNEFAISIQPFVLTFIIFTLLYSVFYKILKKVPIYNNKIKNIANFIAIFGFSLGLIMFLKNTIQVWTEDNFFIGKSFFQELMYWAITFWFLITGSISLWLRGRVQKWKKTNELEKYLIFIGFIIICYQVNNYICYYKGDLSGLLIQTGLIILVTLIPFSISIFLNNRENHIHVKVFSCSLLIIYTGIIILSVLKPFGLSIDFDRIILIIIFLLLLLSICFMASLIPFKFGRYQPKTHKNEKPQPKGPSGGVDVQVNINFELKTKLVDALLSCTSMSDRDSRNAVVNELRSKIKSSISRNNTDRIDVVNIVSRCLDYPDGINELASILRTFEGGSTGMQNVERVLNEIRNVTNVTIPHLSENCK